MKSILLVLFLLVAGCASTQYSTRAVETDNFASDTNVRVSYEVKQEYSTEYFGMVNVAFYNPTHAWIQVDSILLEADSKDDPDNIIITGGEDLQTWFQSMNNEKLVESYNRQAVWGTISLGAAMGGALSNNQEMKAGARAVGEFSRQMMTLERFNTMRDEINLSDYFPEDHLLRTPFRIPPGLTVHKWMVINSQVKSADELVHGLKMKAYYRENTERNYDLVFIAGLSEYTGAWQGSLVSAKRRAVTAGRYKPVY
jgi:hypothetical protein